MKVYLCCLHWFAGIIHQLLGCCCWCVTDMIIYHYHYPYYFGWARLYINKISRIWIVVQPWTHLQANSHLWSRHHIQATTVNHGGIYLKFDYYLHVSLHLQTQKLHPPLFRHGGDEYIFIFGWTIAFYCQTPFSHPYTIPGHAPPTRNITTNHKHVVSSTPCNLLWNQQEQIFREVCMTSS